jgi:hypothetical protein
MRRYWTGILLVVIGVMFLFDSFGWMKFDEIVRKYWPVAFILIGVNILFKHRQSKS